jgi:HD-GYP domain-containing protein (c-di-GMP phosphodiesterase class II)
MTAASSPDEVNPHYLDHVVEASDTHEVEASEDIVSGNGTKLIAKGARIDAKVRDRLLEHKLSKPLEECVQVTDGVKPEQFVPLAEQLLAQQPMLSALCPPGKGQSLPASLAGLTLSAPVQSLLTVYGQSQDGRLTHAVGVSMLGLSLARQLMPGDAARQRQVAIAGLLHDVGELYIDPTFLRRGTRLSVSQWKHVVTHPLVGHRVLRNMPGAGQAVAEAVLMHHERLDGFGYPRGVAGAEFRLDGQILAVAEWLMALVDSGLTPSARASVASRLVPGEFAAPLAQLVADAARAPEAQAAVAARVDRGPMQDAVPRVVRIAATLGRFRESRGWIDQQIESARPAVRLVLEACLTRMLRIQASFSSTGLDALAPDELIQQLTALDDPATHLEVMNVVQELEWRMREIERQSVLRAGVFEPGDQKMLAELIVRLKGLPEAAAH